MHRPLAAFADIVLEMETPRASAPLSRSGRGGDGTCCRIFTGVGRYPGTLQRAAAELSSEGTDYVLLPDSPPPHPPLLGTLQTLLADSLTALTRHEILARWPGEPPRQDTLWRTLARGIETGLFEKTGGGTKADAFRYSVVRQRADVVKSPDLAMDATEGLSPSG